MITWMQRHRKYLVVTIWISTIAFVGAGFVGWGQYSYGDKAGAVAKVGDTAISMRDLQQQYSRLYNQYSQLFQGDFDEAQAKSLGLQKQALKQLIDRALILNLANSYNLRVTNEELFGKIKEEIAFFKDGSFDRETYTEVLKQSGMSKKEYEEDIRKALLIEKALKLIPIPSGELEKRTLETALYIADKINYKVLTTDLINLDTSDDTLRGYWESRSQNYMTLPQYTLPVATQPPVKGEYSDAEINEYYAANRHTFTDAEGKILELSDAKAKVIAALDEKATRKAALRSYVAFKKGELGNAIPVRTLTIDAKSQKLGDELFAEVAALTPTEPFLKPRKANGEQLIIKLEKITPSEPKSFEAAKTDVLRDYSGEEKRAKLLEMAQSATGTFNGTTTEFLTRDSISGLKELSENESAEFLNALFEQEKKRGYITLQNGKVVLYNIMEQKLLKTSKTDQENSIMRLKSTLLDQGLIELLEKTYDIEIFVEGL